jgi:general secretion pathway protein I
MKRPQSASIVSGFSLIEVVVALAVLAMALVIIYRSMGAGVHSLSNASRTTRAIALAESVLSLRRAVPAGGWSQAGQWEDFRWDVASSPFDNEPGPRIRLHRVDVRVTWTDGSKQRSFSLWSLRPEEAVGGKR